MANLLQLVSTGAPAALSFIKGYLASPVIGGEPLKGSSVIKVGSVGFGGERLIGGILIEPEQYRESERAEISNQMILSIGGTKQYVSDNIAITPRTWTISGYIPADIYEISALFAPSIRRKKAALRDIYRKREITWFKTREGELVRVAIEAMDFETRPDVGNKQPIDITLKEITILSVSTSETGASGNEDRTEARATPEPGSSSAPVPASTGSAPVTPITPPANSGVMSSSGLSGSAAQAYKDQFLGGR